MASPKKRSTRPVGPQYPGVGKDMARVMAQRLKPVTRPRQMPVRR